MKKNSKSGKIFGLLALLVFAFAACNGGAAVLYQQLPDQFDAAAANSSPTHQQIADNFTLTSAAKLNAITWWGINIAPNGSDDFLVRLYSDDSGPDSVREEFAAGAVLGVLTGNKVVFAPDEYDEYQYDLTLTTPVDLSAGTYHLFVQNLNGSAWLWETSPSGIGGSNSRSEDGMSWNPEPFNLAFRLHAVPEPGSMALLLLAGTALLLTRRQIHLREKHQ